MTNIELAQQQGNQAAPNLIEAALKGELGVGGSLDYFYSAFTVPAKADLVILESVNITPTSDFFMLTESDFATEELALAEMERRIDMILNSSYATYAFAILFTYVYTENEERVYKDYCYLSESYKANLISALQAYLNQPYLVDLESYEGCTQALSVLEDLEPNTLLDLTEGTDFAGLSHYICILGYAKYSQILSCPAIKRSDDTTEQIYAIGQEQESIDFDPVLRVDYVYEPGAEALTPVDPFILIFES